MDFDFPPLLRSVETGGPDGVGVVLPGRHGPAPLRSDGGAHASGALAEEQGGPPFDLNPRDPCGGAALRVTAGQQGAASRLGHLPLSGRQPWQCPHWHRCRATCVAR